SGHGFNMPFLTNLTKHPVYKSDKQYRFIPGVAKVTVPPSWPGPTTGSSQQVLDLYILPDMFAQYATGKMTVDQAIAWAEKEMQEIFAVRSRKFWGRGATMIRSFARFYPVHVVSPALAQPATPPTERRYGT